MLVSLALQICVAWLGDGPALNQPAPRAARAIPSGVVPVHYEESSIATAFVPPAPLPEFADEESPQIQFEFSRPEACADSDVCPPAPPAELTLTAPQQSRQELKQFGYRAWVGTGQALIIECDEEAEATGLSPETPQSISQLHHLQIAIRHLEAAGMKSAAQPLKEQHRLALSQMRQKIEQQLAAKQAELRRVSTEIDRLHSVLTGDATLSLLTPSAEDDLPFRHDALSSGEPILVITPLSSVLDPTVPEPTPVTPMSNEELESWRRAWSLPPAPPTRIAPNSRGPRTNSPFVPGVEQSIQLIPSPASSGYPQLLIPRLPRRGLETDHLPAPAFEPPPAPESPDGESTEATDETAAADRGPVI